MEFVEDNHISDHNYFDSSNICFTNICDEHISSVFEITDPSYDDSFNRSFENCSITSESSSKLMDNMSDHTSSSIENELEVIMHDYRKIISCLKSECYQRSESEIATLSQLLQSISEFMNVNSSELELICQSARLITIDSINTLIIKRYSVVDLWYFCLCGSLRKDDDQNTIINVGNYLGANFEGQEPMISDYNLYSNSDHCELMVIRKDDLLQSSCMGECIIKTNDDDRTVIAVYEASLNHSNYRHSPSYTLSKATPEVLLNNLLSCSNVLHRDFVEDFFVTYKLYSISAAVIMDDITKGIIESADEAKGKVDILSRWFSQSFFDFENDPNKMKFIEDVVGHLRNQNDEELISTLYQSCSNHSSVRHGKTKLSFERNIVPIQLKYEIEIFFITNIIEHEFLKNGDVIVNIDDYSQDHITKDLLKMFCDDQKPFSIAVRNDILGYHEYILKDIKMDSCSLRSVPSIRSYNRCLSDKVSDSCSISTNDSNFSSPNVIDVSPHLKKRPSLIPNFISTLQNGTVGRFFKNPKVYSKTLTPSNKSIIDLPNDMNINFQRPKLMSGSTMSIQRLSRRSKHQRKSAGSNPEIIKSFEEMDIADDSLHPNLCNQNNEYPIRIYWKELFIARLELSSSSVGKSELKTINLFIKPTMPVSEIVILALLKLNLSSAQSNNFFLVEVSVGPNNMKHEKILKPSNTNLRLKIESRFYLKHCSFLGTSLISQKETDKMINEFQTLSLLKLSINELVMQLFLRSHRLLCSISPIDLISHVTSNKATLKIHKQNNNQSGNNFDKYIQLSDFYKNWVITEICSEQSSSGRSKLIHYFLLVAYNAFHIGHIDLFFSIVNGLDSIEILRLQSSWEKVSSYDKKLFQKLKTYLNVSGNMRNLRSVHQNKPSPFIPVTAMVIKDLTMIDETNSTFVEGTVNGLQVNKHLVNFDKMRKMCKLSRIFTNSTCSCMKDKSKPVFKHINYCTCKLENETKLKSTLAKRIEGTVHFNYHSFNFDQKVDRKHSFSNISIKSSSSESVPDSTSPSKCSQDVLIIQSYHQEKLRKWVEFYLSKLEERVITDPHRLSKMSISCEISIQSNQNTLKSRSKSSKSQDDLIIDLEHFQTHVPNPNEISGKAAEILGLKTKSTIHKYKKSGNGS